MFYFVSSGDAKSRACLAQQDQKIFKNKLISKNMRKSLAVATAEYPPPPLKQNGTLQLYASEREMRSYQGAS